MKFIGLLLLDLVFIAGTVWGLINLSMNFELLLFLLTSAFGAIWITDSLFFKEKRESKAIGEIVDPKPVEWAKSFFPVLLVVFLLRSFVVEPFRIPSGSMLPTLHIGDFILVNKMAYGVRLPVIHKKVIPLGEPERGDVAVFRFPGNPQIDYIKRIVGLPGDRITYMNKVLMVNAKPVETEILGRYEGTESGSVMSGANLLRSNMGDTPHDILIDKDMPNQQPIDTIVPEGMYFVMGDNRDNSNDSRFWGYVPDDHLKGKAFMIWMNFDESVQYERIGDWIE